MLPRTEIRVLYKTDIWLESFFHELEKTIQALEEIRSQLKVGMTEEEARKLASQVFQSRGSTKHWHQPYIRFGNGTTLTFHNRLQADYQLQEGDPYYIDLGPVWRDENLNLSYEADYGDTFVFGKNAAAEKCANTARQLFHEAKLKWKNNKFSGQQMYQFLKKRAQEERSILVENVDGHRLGDFPHQKYSKERLSNIPFYPSQAIWVLEVQINDPDMQFGAFYEDLL